MKTAEHTLTDAPSKLPAREVRNLLGLDAACRLLDIKDVTELTGLSKAYVHELIGEGRFPPSIKLGARCSRWRLRDIATWVDGLQ